LQGRNPAKVWREETMAQSRRLNETEQARLNRLVRRIYAIFRRSDGWTVRLERIRRNAKICRLYLVDSDSVGVTEYESNTLLIDYREDILATFVHECLHVIFEDLVEDDIIKLEKFIITNISPRRAKCLLRLMVSNLE
jgi:hypothetical protein